MSLPPLLHHHLETLLEFVNHSLDSDALTLHHRRAVYGYFDTLPGLRGRIARTDLANLAAQRVLPIWEEMTPEFGYLTMPTLMLSGAERLLAAMREGVTAEQLDQFAQATSVEVTDGFGTYSHNLDDLSALAQEMDAFTGESPTSLYYHPWCVFRAALNALNTALGGQGEWRGDAPHFAAIAYARGKWEAFAEQDECYFVPQGTWDYSAPETQAKRRDFWRWWITEAIPTVWNNLQTLPPQTPP